MVLIGAPNVLSPYLKLDDLASMIKNPPRPSMAILILLITMGAVSQVLAQKKTREAQSPVNNNTLVLLDDERISIDALNAIPPDQIEKMDVIKDRDQLEQHHAGKYEALIMITRKPEYRKAGRKKRKGTPDH